MPIQKIREKFSLYIKQVKKVLNGWVQSFMYTVGGRISNTYGNALSHVQYSP
jgi:hypothetical protein